MNSLPWTSASSGPFGREKPSDAVILGDDRDHHLGFGGDDPGVATTSPRVPPPAASPLRMIPGDDLEALFGEALRDGAAHTAQPDKPDFH